MLPRQMDVALYSIIVVLFGTWTTVHLMLCIELAKKDWRRALAGLIAFPMAPYFGHNLRVKRLPTIWVIVAVFYMVALLAGAV